MKEIILLGAGGHCSAVIDVIEQHGLFTIAGIVDKTTQSSENVNGYKIIGVDDDLELLSRRYSYALVTVGQIRDSGIRKNLFNKLKVLGYNKLKVLGYKLPVFASPSAYISKSAKVEEGTIVMTNAFIGANVNIGSNCIINTSSVIEHDTKIGKNCHIATSAVVNGGVNIGDEVFIGSNSTVIQNKKVPDNFFVKAGCILK